MTTSGLRERQWLRSPRRAGPLVDGGGRGHFAEVAHLRASLLLHNHDGVLLEPWAVGAAAEVGVGGEEALVLWLREGARGGAGAVGVKAKRCEGCQLKQPTFGLPAEGKKR
jgi:hypothetical protein